MEVLHDCTDAAVLQNDLLPVAFDMVEGDCFFSVSCTAGFAGFKTYRLKKSHTQRNQYDDRPTTFGVQSNLIELTYQQPELGSISPIK